MTTAVVLSTYNGEKYIEEQLLSLLNQKRQVNKVYICDDGSSDDTVEIIRTFIKANQLTNWTLSINEKNKGWKRNFHDLILSVEEDIIFLCDQDDIWYPEKVAEMTHIMEKMDDINLLACGYDPRYEDGTRRITNRILKTMKNSGKVYPVPINSRFLYVLRPGCSFAVKKAFCHKLDQVWDVDLPHDAMIWRSAIIDGSAYIYDRNLFIWRRYETSSSNPERNAAQYNNRYELQRNVFITSHQLHIKYLDAIKGQIYSGSKMQNSEIQRLLTDCYKYEKNNLIACKNKSIIAYLTNNIKYHSFAPSIKSIFWGLYVLIRTQNDNQLLEKYNEA